MGKHSIEKTEKNKKILKILIILIILVLVCIGIYFIIRNKDLIIKNNSIGNYTVKTKTIENEKLVLKSNADYNRYIEFIFENKVISKLRIYEQFENKDEYEEKKSEYEAQDIFKIIYKNDKKQILEIQKLDLGTDEGLTYEEIYDKYINQIIGSYEVVE